jgi:hypothetical protein
MDEVFPVLAGIMLGISIHWIPSRRLRMTVGGFAGLGLGALASWISGELTISRGFLLIDIAQVIGAAVMTFVLVQVWLRRTSPATRDVRG